MVNAAAGTVTFHTDITNFVNCWNSPLDILHDLKDQDLISPFYGSPNLGVDLWYLMRGISPSSGLRRETDCDGEFLRQILFQTILQALLDLDNGRPCDSRLWRRDLSPDYRNCTESEHICCDHAYGYLQSLDPCVDETVGLEEGTIESLAKRIKKDSINFMESVFLSTSEELNNLSSPTPILLLSQLLDPCI
jgi:hypothetical protein